MSKVIGIDLGTTNSCVSQNLAVQFKARLEHLSHYVFSKALILNVHDGVQDRKSVV